MTFFEWMNDKYPDPDSACGELTLCLRNIDALQDCGCLCRFYPASSAAFHAAQMIRMFNACWFRYCDDCFWFSDFLHDRCVVDPHAAEKSGELLEAYRKYSLGRNRPPRASSAFCSELVAHGFTKRKTKSCMLVSGLRLRNA